MVGSLDLGKSLRLLESIAPILFQVIVTILKDIHIPNLQQKDVHENNQRWSNTVPQWVQVLRTMIIFNKKGWFW